MARSPSRNNLEAGAETPTPAPPTMTAGKPTHTRSDNSGVTPGVQNLEDDAQYLLDYLREVESETIDSLAKKAGLRQERLRSILDDLQERDLVDVESGLWTVRVQATDAQDSVATDGGRDDTDAFTTAANLNEEALADADVELPLSDLLNVLANERRRKTIRHLHVAVDGDETIAQGDLARRVAAAEQGIHPDAVPSSTKKSVYVSLQQTHLDLLDDLGILTIQRRSEIRPTTDLSAFVAILDALEATCNDETEANG